jgi:glycogen synthase
VPLVATIHATEYGRHQGWLPGADEQAHPPDRVVADLRGPPRHRLLAYMREQLEDIFACPHDKLDVVPNGVACGTSPSTDRTRSRRSASPRPARALVLFAGRLEYEKGVQTVLAGPPHVRGAVGPT